MIEERIVFTLKNGLNAEIATRFVQIASRYTSRIMLHYGDKEVNAKSIMSLLTLAIAPGESFVIRVKGEDESAAIKALVNYLQSGEGSAYPIH